MRILHLITWLNYGGLENWLLNMLQAVPRDACAMDVCCKGPVLGQRADLARRLGVEVLHCPLGPTLVGFVRRLRQILVAGHYDVLHVHLDAHNGLPVYVARSLRLPVVATFHATEFPPMTGWLKLPIIRALRGIYTGVSLRYTLRHANLITGVSQGVLDALYGAQGWAVPADARVLHLGAPAPAPIAPAERVQLREQLGIPHTAPVIVHVGSLVTCKNHFVLIEAFERIANVVSESRLLVIGDGPLRAALQQRAAESPFRGRIQFLGTRSDVAALLQISDLFLFPSRREGLPVVLLEAQAAGLPIVAARIPGIMEAVQDGHTAVLHDPDDAVGMAASAVEILNSPARAQAFSAAGRERHKALFTLEAAANRLVRLYADGLMKPSSSLQSRISS